MYNQYTIFLLFLAFCTQRNLATAAIDTFLIHTDFPEINNDQKMLLDVFYSSDSFFKGVLCVQFYKYETNGDSILVLNSLNTKFGFKKGVNKTIIDFSKEDTNVYYASKFYEILKRTSSVPPGSYKVIVTVKRDDKAFKNIYLHDIDSALSPSSPVRQDINKSLAHKSKSFLGIRLSKVATKETSTGVGATLMNVKNKVDKSAKKRGLKSVHYQKNGKSYVDLYYQDWFAGRYEVKNNESLSKQIDKQESMAGTANLNLGTTGGLDQPSLFSQYKRINKDKKDKEDIVGEIGLTTNVSNAQEQYSDVNNNYVELRGRLEVPICGIPIEMEGLYTTQDEHQEIKASYFKIHYDVDKMRSDLQKSMSSYNSKFAETKSKGTGMQQVYNSSISNLEGQKAKLQSELDAETSGKSVNTGQLNNDKLASGITSDLQKQAKDTSGLKQRIISTVDSAKAQQSQGSVDSTKTPSKTSDTTVMSKASGDEKKAKDAAVEKQKRIEAKSKQIEALDKKIEKYKLLLAQYQNTNHFDSLVGYDKTKDIGNQSDMTYRQMVKKSSGELPDGQAKGFISGITTMDAGMFAKDESKYTMSGQMMKGLSVGYDLGFCETGATVGKTQYVGSDGSLDKYTFYSGKMSFKPAKKQKISLIYYEYSPDRKMVIGDAFFNNANISAPSFFQPVQIISTKYDGSISKFVTIGGEVATSIKQADNTDVPVQTTGDKMAYHFNVDGKIPRTAITLEATYDKIGLGFVNSTLPVSLSGTEQYKVAGKTDFFQSFLTVGLEYDRMVQSNFVSNATSTKMGFNIKTNSKKYPNLSFSYKPFTTFQSYTDTLNIPQRPLVGSVWTGKATYQIRRHEKSLRFSVLYNKSMTTMDTTKYGSTTSQASCIYSDKIITTSVTIGTMQLSGINISLAPVTTPNNTSFLDLGVNYVLSKQVSFSGGLDLGVAPFGFCKYSMNGGISYHFKKCPLMARVNLRFTDYELNQGNPWTQLYSGNIDLMYKIKAKTKEKNNL